MDTKEPYYHDDVTQKSLLTLSPHLLKVPLTTDFPLIASDKLQTPSLGHSLRRGSMEPYYRNSSRRNTNPTLSSTLSSALFSDVFDYHYLDRRMVSDDNAIASDSDTDYEDYDVVNPQKSSRGSSRNYVSDSDSELEDYNVHFLTFKVNARAQFTRPPQTSMAAVSDYFDSPPRSPRKFNLLATYHHPEFLAPDMAPHQRGSTLEGPVDVLLAEYLEKCGNPLAETGCTAASFTAPTASVAPINDCYSPVPRKELGCSDMYESPQMKDHFI